MIQDLVTFGGAEVETYHKVTKVSWLPKGEIRDDRYYGVVERLVEEAISRLESYEKEQEVHREISSVAFHQLKELTDRMAKYEYKKETVEERKRLEQEELDRKFNFHEDDFEVYG